MGDKGIVCVTGASGFVGSWLVMKLLEQGYTVKATVRDPNNMNKVKHLLDLPDAGTRLTLWKADLRDEGSFDEAIHGCEGVFHVATPMFFEAKDPENLSKDRERRRLRVKREERCDQAMHQRIAQHPAVMHKGRHRPEGGLHLIGRGSQDAKAHKSMYTDDDWSDVDFCRDQKMMGWMYLVSKTLAEKAAFEFADKNNIDFVSILPTLVVGEFITPTLSPSILSAVALITRNTSRYFFLNPVHMVHLDDLCIAHIFLFEHPEAKGRYMCSSHHDTMESLANMLRNKFPEYDIPADFEGIEEISDVVIFSSKKLTDLGFEFKYNVEDMYEGAIKACREKGLLPLATKK